MKYAFLFLGLVLAAPAYAYGVNASASVQATPVACTMEYAPVCGYHLRADNQCVGNACRTYKTYGNQCQMSADGARHAHDGACTAAELPAGGSDEPENNAPEAFTPPKGCVAWYDGCNSCSVGANGSAACTLRACFAYQPGYCTKWDETPIPVEPDGGIGNTPPHAYPAEGIDANAEGSASVPGAEIGFFARIWANLLRWF